MGTVTRQLLALLLLLLQRDNAHAASGDLYKQASLFAIWGRDCQLPYDAERNCSESNNEADALAGLLPPPKAFAPCPDGYSCRCCFSKKDCAPDQGQCAPCSYQGEYCPEGTINEYSYVDASHCPPGKICKTTTSIEDCKAGYFCPGAIFAYVDQLKCDDEIGLYCPAGSSKNTTGCKAGFYCPTPDQQLLCPEGHFCREFSKYPRKCPISSHCPAGSEVPQLSFGGIAIAVMMLSLVAPLLLYLQYRKMASTSRNNLRVARLLQQQENISVLVNDVLCVKEQAKMLVGMNIVGFCKKEFPVEISFENLRLELPNGIVPLADVSGTFQHSRMTAVMGNSGSGKSTLVKTLLGFNHQGKVSGITSINGSPARLERIKRVSAFVQQDDLLVPFADLTVSEILRCSAKLRLPASWTEAEKKLIVDGCLQLLNLVNVQHMRVGGVGRNTLSGGQRRRVNIGMELVVDPTALYLDEPTSGLSSSDSMLIMKAMWSLLHLQCTIVAIIHSPPMVVWNMFSDVLLLATGGRVAYFGPIRSVLRYWQHIGFFMGESMNAPDFSLDVLTGSVMPRRLHSRFPSTGRYNANDYVIEMWRILHVQDVEEMADGRLSLLIKLASSIHSPEESQLQRASSFKMLSEELKPEEANLLLRMVSHPVDTDATLEEKDAKPANVSSTRANNWLTGLGRNKSSITRAPLPIRPASRPSSPSAPSRLSPYLSNSLGWLSFPSLQRDTGVVLQTSKARGTSTHDSRSEASAESMQAVAAAIAESWETICDQKGMVWANELLRLFATKDRVLEEQDINDLISEIDPHSKGWFNLSDFIEYVNRLRILYDGREYTLALDHQGKLMAEQTDGIHINSTQLRPINTVGERFVPNMIYQLKALVWRAVQQYTRKTRVHTGSSIILVLGGMVVGLLRSYSNDLKDTPSTMCLVSTVMGVLSSASSLSYFGNEKLVHLQESRGGVNLLAYFLSKNVVIAFDNLLHPLLFYASYTQFVYSNLSFVIFWMHLVVVGFATSGIGMTLSILLRSDTALLGSALLPLVSGVFLAGIDPRVLALKNGQLEFFSHFSFARWATEALTVYELSIEDEADQMRVRLIFKRFGFREDRYFLCIAMLVLIGVTWRFLALVLLMSQHKIDEIMLLLPDQEMLWGVVREHTRRWSARAKEWLHGRFGSEDEAEKSLPPHEHAGPNEVTDDGVGIEIHHQSGEGTLPHCYLAT